MLSGLVLNVRACDLEYDFIVLLELVMGDVLRFFVIPLALVLIVAFYFFPDAVRDPISSLSALFGYYKY